MVQTKDISFYLPPDYSTEKNMPKPIAEPAGTIELFLKIVQYLKK